jgi:hypothetical protein
MGASYYCVDELTAFRHILSRAWGFCPRAPGQIAADALKDADPGVSAVIWPPDSRHCYCN